MIARIWHGRVPAGKTDEYRKFLNERAIPDYRSVPGNIAVYIFEQQQDTDTRFITLTFWDDMDAVRAFAGDDPEAAKYYPEDKDFLLEMEPNVVHYQVVAREESAK